MWAKNSIRAINKAKLQLNYIHIIEKEVHQFRKQIKILPTKYRIIKQKIRIQPHGKYYWKVRENFSKLNSHDKQFTQEQSSKNDSPFLYFRHLQIIVLEIPYLTSKEELDLTPVCLPLTRVQYLFIGTFRTQICRNLNLPFTEFWQLVYTNKNIIITLECSLASVPHQPTPQTQIFPCFCFNTT